MNGQMSNINFDNVTRGLQLLGTQSMGVHISNLNIAQATPTAVSYGIEAQPTNPSYLNVNGASFWGVTKSPVYWNSTGLLTLSNARFLSSWNTNNNGAAIEIAGGRAMIHDNYFKDLVGTAIKVNSGSSVDRIMICNNELVGNTITNQGPHTIISNNDP